MSGTRPLTGAPFTPYPWNSGRESAQMGTLVAYVAVGSRAAVGVVFLFAAASKIGRRRRADFRATVTGLVPGARGTRAHALAAAVTVVEGAVVLLLAQPSRSAGVAGLGLAIAALTVFTYVIAAGLRRSTSTPCRCFSTSTRPVSGVHITRNVLLLAVSGLGLAACLADGTGPVQAAGLWVAVGAGALLGLVLTAFDDLTDLFFAPDVHAHPTTAPTSSAPRKDPR